MFHQFISLRTLALRLIALGVLSAGSNATFADSPSVNGLSFQAAIQKILQHNPDLAVYQVRQKEFAAQKNLAALKPAYEAGFDAENLAATHSTDESPVQFTLSLSSVIEPSSKREARLGLASASADYLLAEQQLQALDLLTKAGQHFANLLSLQEQQKLARQSVDLAQKTLAILNGRAKAGALFEADLMREQAELSNARLRLSRVESQWRIQAQALSTMWGAPDLSFDQAVGELYRVAKIPPLNQAKLSLYNHPRIDLLAEQTRMQQARLALAQSQSATDIRWSLGVRHFEATDSQALVAGLSVPLFSAQRSQSKKKIARVGVEATQAEKDAALLNLQQLLFEAYENRQYSVQAIRTLRESTLPALQGALEATESAYKQGRYSYFEWHTAQQDYLQAQQSLIEAGAQLQSLTLLIEQLINAPVLPVHN